MTLLRQVLMVLVLLLAIALTTASALANQRDGSGPGSYSETPYRVTRIYFDYTDSEAIHLRKNSDVPIPKPEWVLDRRSGAALYVQNTPVTIRVRLEAPPQIDHAWIWAEGTGPLGGLVGRRVNFQNGVSDPEYYVFRSENPTPPGLGRYQWNWNWFASRALLRSNLENRLFSVEPMTVTGPHEIYTVLDSPGLPWETDDENNQNPWSEALDQVVDRIEALTPLDALNELTEFYFDRPGFEYDIWNGASCYFTWAWGYNLSLVIQDLRNERSPRVGCCYDGAAFVHTFGGLIGADTQYVISGWGYTENVFGYLNCIDPIGRGRDLANSPFHENYYFRDDPLVYQDGDSGSCGRSAFGNHAFAASEPGAIGVIWDATMCADLDENADTFVEFPPDGGYTSTFLAERVLEDVTQSWVPNQWLGMYLNPNTDGHQPDPYQEYFVVGNTQTEIFVTGLGRPMTDFATAGDKYWIRDPGNDAAQIHYLAGYPWLEYEAIAVDGDDADPPINQVLTVH